MQGAVQPIARNLRRWRIARGLTLTALAEQAGVAKSTVSLIERGQGNPSIDTVWALATALGVPFASLFHDESPADDMSVLREEDAPVVAVEQAGLQDSDGLLIRHILSRGGGGLIEIYMIVLEEGAVRHSGGHVNGIFEHLIIAVGTVEVSTEGFTETAKQGDMLSFRADQQHTYRAVGGPVRLYSVHEYPKSISG